VGTESQRTDDAAHDQLSKAERGGLQNSTNYDNQLSQHDGKPSAESIAADYDG
jgi:hypothetical protein